jgi:hypothetical protein
MAKTLRKRIRVVPSTENLSRPSCRYDRLFRAEPSTGATNSTFHNNYASSVRVAAEPTGATSAPAAPCCRRPLPSGYGYYRGKVPPRLSPCWTPGTLAVGMGRAPQIEMKTLGESAPHPISCGALQVEVVSAVDGLTPSGCLIRSVFLNK